MTVTQSCDETQSHEPLQPAVSVGRIAPRRVSRIPTRVTALVVDGEEMCQEACYLPHDVWAMATLSSGSMGELSVLPMRSDEKDFHGCHRLLAWS